MTTAKSFKRTKRPLALWTQTFKEQHKHLRPENSVAGGLKQRSQPEHVRMDVYNAIAKMFKAHHPFCESCERKGNVPPRYTDDVHHTHGREGLLLFDVRKYLAVCRTCHNWIGDNPEQARKLGLLCAEGYWNKT